MKNKMKKKSGKWEECNRWIFYERVGQDPQQGKKMAVQTRRAWINGIIWTDKENKNVFTLDKFAPVPVLC